VPGTDQHPEDEREGKAVAGRLFGVQALARGCPLADALRQRGGYGLVHERVEPREQQQFGGRIVTR
jgi:hypothetical protein